MIGLENGLKMAMLVNWSNGIGFVSQDKFCFGLEMNIVRKGAMISGNIIFMFGLNISFEAIFDI